MVLEARLAALLEAAVCLTAGRWSEGAATSCIGEGSFSTVPTRIEFFSGISVTVGETC